MYWNQDFLYVQIISSIFSPLKYPKTRRWQYKPLGRSITFFRPTQFRRVIDVIYCWYMLFFSNVRLKEKRSLTIYFRAREVDMFAVRSECSHQWTTLRTGNECNHLMQLLLKKVTKENWIVYSGIWSKHPKHYFKIFKMTFRYPKSP